MNVLNDNANARDDVNNLRMKFYHSMNTEQENNYCTGICSFLNELRKIHLLCDVTLVTEDNVGISAHKAILVVASQYFVTKFTNYDENRLLIKGFHSSTLEPIIQFAYTNDITINENNVEVILQAADYFCMEILKNMCCDFLSKTITLPNCLRIRSLADLYACESLLTTCDNLIKKHFTEIIKDEGFLDFALNDLLKILKDDNLNVPSEMMVYTAVMNWIKYDLEKREKHLYELIRYVRLPFLGRDRLLHLFCSETLFKNSPNMQLVLNAFVEENILSGSSLNILNGCMPIPRTSYSSIPKMFVIGGTGSYDASNSAEYFNIRSRKWHSVNLNNGRDGASAVSIRNQIFVTGGAPYRTSPSTSVEILDIKTENWTTSSQNSNMLTFRKYHAAVLLNNKIYVIGGLNQHDQLLASVEYYCFERKIWNVAPNTIEPRAYASATVLNGKIYVIGALKDSSPSMEYYDSATSTWNLCKNMNYSRHGAGVCAVNNLLYVVGGRDDIGDTSDKVEAYDPMTDSWEIMPNLPVPRKFHGVCHDNGYIFVVGGERNYEVLSSIDVFNCDTKTWSTMATGLSVGRKKHSVVMAYESH